MDLRIARADPLAHAAEIKRLFVEDGRPEFPDFFDRAYPAAVQAGATSWLGRDENGRLVAHVACFPHSFVLGGRDLRGGLLVNLIVARAHRTFGPAVALLRRVLGDLQDAGGADFLYSDPNEAGRVVLRAAGFAVCGHLQRFVLPLADRRWWLNAATRAYGLWTRLRAPRLAGAVAEQGAVQVDLRQFEDPPGHSAHLRPRRPAELYRWRLAGYPSPLDHWVAITSAGLPAASVAAALVRGPDAERRASLLAVWRRPEVSLRPIVRVLGEAARRRGVTRVQLWTIAESGFATECRAAGFLPRADRVPVLARAVTPSGAAALAAVNCWDTTEIDYDRGLDLAAEGTERRTRAL